ncbi:MAG: hypothetical protein WC785_04220 [Tatlockia sp.]|jgi:hypothetical protein
MRKNKFTVFFALFLFISLGSLSACQTVPDTSDERNVTPPGGHGGYGGHGGSH